MCDGVDATNVRLGAGTLSLCVKIVYVYRPRTLSIGSLDSFMFLKLHGRIMLPSTLSRENIKKALDNPSLIRKESTRILLAARNGYQYGEGIDVMSEDWDNLIILDACRYDYFSNINDIQGDLQKVTSKGKSSWGFVKHNFVGRELHDTVAVIANPFYNRISDDVFHALRSTLENVDRTSGDVNSIENCHPETVTKKAVSANEQFPEKRLVIHFMQPHQPYIGPTGDELRDRIAGTDLENRGSKKDYISYDGEVVTASEMRQAYAENLELVLRYVKELIGELDGKSVITADHGQLKGERVLGSESWGHGYQWEVPEVREVPWHVVDSNTRRKVTTEEPVDMDRLEAESLSEHLEALGYG